ncbi:MAG: SWIM zinc finger family protein, partial [Candidatus Tectimicrobiota bacterium]
MSTLAHPVPSRMTHNVAALFGHVDDTLVAWQQACKQAADALQPLPDPARLAKALALAQDGAVTLDAAGHALVTSGDQRYPVQADGLCACPDATHRGVPCKHRLAVHLHQ